MHIFIFIYYLGIFLVELVIINKNHICIINRLFDLF